MRKDKGLNGDLDRLPMLTWIMFLKFLDDTEKVREEEAELAGKKFRPAIDPPYRWRDWAANPMASPARNSLPSSTRMKPCGLTARVALVFFAYLKSLQSTNGDRRDVIASVSQGTINRMVNGYLLRDIINKVNDIHFTSQDEIHT